MILFKYHDINKHLFDLLSKQMLHCCDRLKLNDPYDGIYLITAELRDKLSKNAVSRVRGKLSKSHLYDQIPDELIDFFAQESFGNQEFYDLIHNSQDKLSLTICSFTETNNNELMWAHYSNNFRGICLEFDFTNEPLILEHLVKVKYDNSIPKIDGFEYEEIKKASSIKREAWNYEREWRVLHVDPSIKFAPLCLKTIYLGARTTEEDFELIKTVCTQNELKHVDFVRTKIDLEGIIFK